MISSLPEIQMEMRSSMSGKTVDMVTFISASLSCAEVLILRCNVFQRLHQIIYVQNEISQVRSCRTCIRCIHDLSIQKGGQTTFRCLSHSAGLLAQCLPQGRVHLLTITYVVVNIAQSQDVMELATKTLLVGLKDIQLGLVVQYTIMWMLLSDFVTFKLMLLICISLVYTWYYFKRLLGISGTWYCHQSLCAES